MHLRSTLLVGAALLSGPMAASPAAADDTHTKGERADVFQIEDIVVTARRRDETLQTTPVAVTAVTGAGLEARQATSLDSLANLAPALTINSSVAFSGSSQSVAVFMRGIGQTDFTLNTDPGVGIYVDGVYISRSVGGLLDLVDIDRVEVLRGPQGTLFGRNSVGGAINITTNRPGDRFGGRAYASIGSDNLQIIGGYLDAPLSETLHTKLAIQNHRQDGYVRRRSDGFDFGDKNMLSGRFSADWRPSDRFEADVDADFSTSREHGVPLILTQVSPGAAFPAAHNLIVAPQLNPALANVPGGCLSPAGAAIGGAACYDARWITGDLSSTNSTAPSFSNADVWGVALTGVYRATDHLTVKSITGYRHLSSHFARDNDGSPLQIGTVEDQFRHHQLSQEVQLLGDALDGRLSYLAGGFLFDEKGDNPNIVDFGFVRFLSGGRVHNSSAAVFGQATYKVTDALSATLGLRYTEETKRFTPDQFIISGYAVPFFPPFLQFTPGQRLTTSAQQTAHANELTPHVNLSYRPNDQLMVYASYSKGFKSGGFTQRIFPALPTPPSFAPETVSVYEAGAKLDLFDKRLRIDGATYFTDYQDLQVTVPVGVAPTTQNAASARIEGAELEFTAVPVDGLTATLAAGYTDAHYRSLDARVSPSITLRNRFPGTSKWTANGSLAYALNVAEAMTLTPRLDWSFRSGFFFDAENQAPQRAYGLVDTSLTLAPRDQDWNVALFGKNIGNVRYATHVEQILDPAGWAVMAPARGAEWGVRAGKSF